MKIFILCAGTTQRWCGAVKQLAIIRGEPLLSRTLQMLEGRDYTILTKHPAIFKAYGSCNCMEPTDNTKLLSTVVSTFECWQDYEEICFLMGDVVFTDNALEIILSPNNKSFQFYGSLEEHFAFRFTKEMYARVKDACESIIASTRKGTTWELYRYLVGIPLYRDWTDRWFRTLILDWTDDIDYPGEYEVKQAVHYFERPEFDL